MQIDVQLNYFEIFNSFKRTCRPQVVMNLSL
ncbi:hypothetical protein SAMN04488556_0699 [Halostagnicola kamekurae]|uniref:Uncharacterized protein n=1 Tax=Halostagnicola kamekurae TaxID=619731 RepID=A0A1I6PP89_9EURY|nr:hypothetical protein SAMN04488556_0699 [Halostagnicola kamekurae]